VIHKVIGGVGSSSELPRGGKQDVCVGSRSVCRVCSELVRSSDCRYSTEGLSRWKSIAVCWE
jgi:hypothetical protein